MITVIHVSEYGDAINWNSWELDQLSKNEQNGLPQSVALKYLMIVDESDIHGISSNDKLIVLNHKSRELRTLIPIRPQPKWTVKES